MIQRAAEIPVDERAAVNKLISQQYVDASQDDVDAQLNYMRVEVNKGLSTHLTLFVASCQVRRATAMMRSMEGVGFGSLADAIGEFQGLLPAGLTVTRTDDSTDQARLEDTATRRPALNAGDSRPRRSERQTDRTEQRGEFNMTPEQAQEYDRGVADVQAGHPKSASGSSNLRWGYHRGYESVNQPTQGAAAPISRTPQPAVTATPSRAQRLLAQAHQQGITS